MIQSATPRWLGLLCLLRLLACAGEAARDAGGGELEVVLDDVCVRGVEMAPRGSRQTLLTNLTHCTVVSLLAISPQQAGSLTSVPLDESAVSAVLRADALLVRGMDDAAAVAALYGRLLRGGASVLVADGVDSSFLSEHFTFQHSKSGYSWWRRRTPGGSLGLKLGISAPRDGEVFAFESGDRKAATINVHVRVPPADLLRLLPMPRLRLAADADAAKPIDVVLPWNGSTTAVGADGAVTVGDDGRGVELTLSAVPAGSHLITASLGYGKSRVVSEATWATMIDVVPDELLRRRTDVVPSLGCSRAAEAAKHAGALAPPVEVGSTRKRLRVALADVLPSAMVDGQRRVWLQRCAHWARQKEKHNLELSYLLLYDDLLPPLRADAPLRRAVEATGVRATAVAAPWHLNQNADASKGAKAAAPSTSLSAAMACARGDGDLSGAARAWIKYLNQSVDVLITHAAPGIGGATGDAARLGCLGRLAALAGVGARLVELPTVSSADALGWRGNAFYQTGRANVGLPAAWADAFIVPSHYAALATSEAMKSSQFSQWHSLPVVVVQPGVDDKWFAAGALAEKARRLADVAAPRKKLAVWVGRLDADKSPLLFVRACALVTRDVRDSECLVIGDGPLAAALALRADAMALAAQRGAEPGRRDDAPRTTRFLGFRADDEGLADAVASADVLVSTSVFPETFGLAPLEAAAAGVAVVAFGVAGMAEHVCDGVNALVPSEPTPAALAETIKMLLDDPLKARRLGANGAAAAAAHFGAAAAADRAALLLRRTWTALTDHKSRCSRPNATDCAHRPVLSPVYDAQSFLSDLSVLPFLAPPP
ncbi:hypothetical protein M885DRAFT_566461 [Pelagophyceae sp. CCMP2097]|nr:hypothetical protein M885DRAFT_566461 [Pelagophyceae sp. CCMP2097]